MQFRGTPAQNIQLGHENQAEYLEKSHTQVTAMTVYIVFKERDNLLLSLITLKTVMPVTCLRDFSNYSA